LPQLANRSRQLLVPDRELSSVHPLFQKFRTWLLNHPHVVDCSPEIAVNFAEDHTEGSRKPASQLDKVRDLFRTLFRCIGKDADSPARDTIFKKAKSEIIISQTTVMTPPPPHVDWDRLVTYLKANPVAPNAKWEQIRNHAFTLYTLALGRRPSNATRAIIPTPLEITPWGIRISEFKFKQDGSRKGHHVFLPSCSNRTVCPVVAIKRYLDHPTTIDLVSFATHSLQPGERVSLFLKRPGIPLQAGTVSARIQELFKSAMISPDIMGRQVTPRDIRPAVFSKLKNLAQKVSSTVINHMQSWKLKKVSSKFYLRAGGPPNWSNFIFNETTHPIQGGRFLWVTVEDYHLWLRDSNHQPELPDAVLGIQEVHLQPSDTPSEYQSHPDSTLSECQSLPRYTTGSVGRGSDLEWNEESVIQSVTEGSIPRPTLESNSHPTSSFVLEQFQNA
jgi:D-ribose pyranose/furanose isomerase RbsD